MLFYSNDNIFLQNENKERVPVKIEVSEGALYLYQQDNTCSALARMSKTMVGYNSRTVTLEKTDRSFGLALKGGADYNHPIVVSKIDDNSPASLVNILVGDIIVEINDKPTFDKNHDKVIQLIRQSGDRINLHLVSVKDFHGQSQDDCFSLLDIIPDEGKWSLTEKIELYSAYLTQYSIKQKRKLTNAFQLEVHPSKILKFHCPERLEKCLEKISENIIFANKEKVKELKASYSLHDLVFMGWINESISSSKYNKIWTKKFLVLTKELKIYSQYPTSIEQWQSAELCYELYDITWKTLTEQPLDVAASDYRPNSIFLQSATGVGHTIAFDSAYGLEYWQKEITNKTINVVKYINARVFTAKWKRDAVDFNIDLKRGFVIQDTSTMKEIWKKPFVELCSSSDDGGNKLFLKFENEEQTIEVTELHSVLCTIEAFLKTAIHDIEN